MSMKFIAVKCPSCGANLPMEEGRTQMYCSLCGASIIMTNENEHVYRHVDEARVKQAETDQIVRLKEMEIAEKNRVASEKTKAIKIKISIILGIVGSLLMMIGFIGGEATGNSDSSIYMFAFLGMFCLMAIAYIWIFSANKDKESENDGRIRVPSNLSDYESKNYTVVESIFQSAGFTNVRSVAMNDLTTGLLKKPGMVASITINGQEITSCGKRFYPDATVLISYHSFAR